MPAQTTSKGPCLRATALDLGLHPPVLGLQRDQGARGAQEVLAGLRPVIELAVLVEGRERDYGQRQALALDRDPRPGDVDLLSSRRAGRQDGQQ